MNNPLSVRYSFDLPQWNKYRSLLCGTTIPLFCFSLFLLLFLIAPVSVHGMTKMEFDGPGVTHLVVDEYSYYDYSNEPVANHCFAFSVYLVNIADGTEIHLADGEERDGKLWANITVRRTDLTRGHYAFRKKESLWDVHGEITETILENDFHQFTLQLDSDDNPSVMLDGTMLYNESFSLGEPDLGDAHIGVVVNDGLQLGISDAGEAEISIHVNQEAKVFIDNCNGILGVNGDGAAEITNCKFVGYNGVTSSVNSLTITSCGMRNLLVDTVEELIISDCLIKGGAYLNNIINFTISNSEFHEAVDLTAETGSFTGNAVYGLLTLDSPVECFSPTISGNAFLSAFYSWYRYAVSSTFDINLDSNYWAGGGLGYPGVTNDLWVKPSRQQHVPTNRLITCPGYNPSSVEAPRPTPKVAILANSGQGLLGGGYAVQGRDTLLSIATYAPVSDHLENAQITLSVGDENIPITAVNASSHKIRDPHSIPNSTENANHTLNFIIPADLTMVDSLNYTITVDTTGATGYSTPGRIYTNSHSLLFDKQYGRKLRIGVMPIHIDIDGYLPKPLVKAVDKTVQILRQRIPAMWPIAAEQVAVETLTPYQYDGGMLPYLARAHAYGLMNDLSNALRIFRNQYNASALEPLDFIVAVLPVNALGGADGSNLKLRRNIAMVDESSPDAAVHELGHALGLYTSTEQYDMSPGPSADGYIVANKGVVLQNTTIFNSENTSVPPNPNRIRHFGGLTTNGVFDFMGNDKKFWVSQNSYRLAGESLRTLLGTAGATPSPKISQAAAVDTVNYRLVLGGALERMGDDSLQLVPESISGQEGESYGSAGFEPTIELGYELQSYDVNGLPLGQPLLCHHDLDNSDPAGHWRQSFVLPLETSRIEISNTEEGVIWAMEKVAPATVIFNQLPTSLTGDLNFSWTVEDGEGSTGMGRNELYMQSSTEAPFLPMGNNSTENSYTISASDIPVSDTIAFRLIHSEGFGNAVTHLSEGHTKVALPPSITITNPVDQDTAAPDTFWTFAASANADSLRSAENQEGSLELTYAWTSSLDNALGDTAILNSVQLSSGLHIITCIVTDSEGLQSTDQIEVNVAPQTTVDLHLHEDAIDVLSDGLDPIFGGGAFVQDVASALNLTFRNGGLPGTATVTVALTPPNGVPVELLNESFDWDPLQSRTLVTSYVPQATGTHIVTATISMVDENGLDLESAPSDNTRIWTFENQAPQAHGQEILLRPDQIVDLTLFAADLDSTNLSYTINSQPTLGTLSGIPPNITYTAGSESGEDSFSFFVQDNQPVASDIVTVAITIAESPDYVIHHTISISNTLGGSTNPTGDVQVDQRQDLSVEFIPATGYLLDYFDVNSQNFGTYSPFQLTNIRNDVTIHAVFTADQDQDNIPDEWEITYFGNISPTPEGDFDTDGLSNIREYEFRTNPTNPDTDGDGLTDLYEINTLLNPLHADTDGDGMPDGWEVRVGLIPQIDDAIADADEDGISNINEYLNGTNPLPLCGDVSDDTYVNLTDIIQTLQTLSGVDTNTNINGDCDGDMQIGTAEAIAILQYIVNSASPSPIH